MADHNAAIIEEFRTHEGKVGGYWEGRTLLLLTHKGAKSGRVRTNPLGYLEHEGRVFVFATKGGSPAHPHWFLNLKANPDVVVERRTERYEATAVEITGPERDEIYARQVEVWPQFGPYETKTSRTIPVVELVRKS
jgi:deazaflavin-dependent oxidoreductase (nitroreductase family)